MAICGRCFLCQRKFECVPGRMCEACADTDADRPARLIADWLPNEYREDGEWYGWKICVSCVKAIGQTEIGDAVSGILRFAHEKNGESI